MSSIEELDIELIETKEIQELLANLGLLEPLLALFEEVNHIRKKEVEIEDVRS